MERPAPDADVVRAARGNAAFDLAIGEALLQLFGGDRLIRLGFARQSDYARERLGVAPRTMFLWTRLARGVADRPCLRRAVRAGAVSARKALAVLDVARGEREAEWTFAARHLTLAELEKRVRDAGGEPRADTFEVESIVLRMSSEEQDRLDAALELARKEVGPGAPRWQQLEAICQEWLGEFAGLDPLDVEFESPAPAPVAFDAGDSAPPPEIALPTDPFALDAYVRALWRRRQRRDEELGRLLLPFRRSGAWRALGFSCFDDYCRERLGISPSNARQRIWLERRMCALPELREALMEGRLTLTKALLVAKHATPHDVARRIAEAAKTSCRQTESETTQEEDRQNRAAGVRRLWGPREAAETVLFAIAALQRIAAARAGNVPADGEALAIIADHFVEVWRANAPPKKVPRARRAVLARNRGLCAVPGCSCAAAHEHHIVFRSHGGSNAVGNRVGVCAAHHLRGIHEGHLTVTGDADERLVWRFAATGEEWITTAAGEERRGSPRARGRMRADRAPPTVRPAGRRAAPRRTRRARGVRATEGGRTARTRGK